MPDTRFQPGRSGNPGGRPKGRSVTARLRDLLLRDEIDGKPLKGDKQVADVAAEVLLKLALGGDLKALKYLIDRNDQTEVEELRKRIEALERSPDDSLPKPGKTSGPPRAGPPGGGAGGGKRKH